MALLPDLESAEQAYERAHREMLEWALEQKNVDAFLADYRKNSGCDVIIKSRNNLDSDVNLLIADEYGLILRTVQAAIRSASGNADVPEQTYHNGWEDACRFISNQLEQAALSGQHPLDFSAMRAAASIARRAVDEATSTRAHAQTHCAPEPPQPHDLT